MLFLAKAAGIAILIWFYLNGKKHDESPIKWAVIGVMGYWIAWWAIKLTLVAALYTVVAKSATGAFILIQIPALVGIGAAFLIRNKLIADAAKKGSQ